MSESLRNALLEQMGGSAIATELQTLNRLAESERRRSHRLKIWTIAVWGVWFALIAAALAVPAIQKANAPRRPIATQPTTVVVATRPPLSTIQLIVGATAFVSVFALPIVGALLLIRVFFSHRTAGTRQIQASLANIEAQLKLLTTQRPPPPA